MWQIEINFADKWTVVADGYSSKDDAEWAIGQWKQANKCIGDRCWRTAKVS